MTHAQFATKMFELQVNSHIAHLQSTSYAQHMALNELYSGLVDLIDRYIESAQSVEIVRGYGNIAITEGANIKTILLVRKKEIETHKSTLTEGHLQQICDDFSELISSTLYKLTYLK